jgi:hypothetical protein
MTRLQFLYLWSVAVGAMDACTGLLLIFVPEFTLRMMGVAAHPEALVFISWMGVFIAAVGMSYGLVFRGGREATTVWSFTSVVRLMVTVYLTWKISIGELPVSWGLVAIADGIVSVGQLIILRAGWWEGGR